MAMSEQEKRTAAAMETVVDFGNGSSWREITTHEEALATTRMSGTAIVLFYDHEAKLENGSHPRRWFALVDESGAAPVAVASMCVLPPGVTATPIRNMADCHITGFQNANPYPQYSGEIETLANVIGIEIEPNWQGRPVAPTETPALASPNP